MAELEATIAELRGETGARIAALERRVDRMQEQVGLVRALARARVGAELQVLKQLDTGGDPTA